MALSTGLGRAALEGPQVLPKATPTPVSVATGTGKPAPKPPPFAGYLTPAQQAAQAAAQAQQSILPKQQAISAAQAADAAAAQRQATDTTGYYAALANVLKGIAPAVNAGYSNAAGADSAFSKGFTDGLAHVQQQAGQTNNDVLGVSGGGVQAGQVAQATGGQGIQDALYGLTGYLPAAGLEREGAAFGAAAAQQPATAAGYGGQQLNRLTQQELLNQQTFGQQKVDLAAQIPGLRQTALNTIQGRQDSLQARQDQISQSNRDYDLRVKAYNAATGKAILPDPTLSGKLGYLVDQSGAAIPDKSGKAQILPGYKWNADGSGAVKLTGTAGTNAAAKVNTTLSAANGFLTNSYGQAILNKGKPVPYTPYSKPGSTGSSTPKYNASISRSLGFRADQFGNQIGGQLTPLPGFKLTADGIGVVKTTGSSAKVGANPGFPNLTKSQVLHLRSGIAAAFNGVPERKDVNGKVTAKALPAVDYQAAIDHAVSAGYSRAGATKMANRFYMRGERGRPKK